MVHEVGGAAGKVRPEAEDKKGRQPRDDRDSSLGPFSSPCPKSWVDAEK